MSKMCKTVLVLLVMVFVMSFFTNQIFAESVTKDYKETFAFYATKDGGEGPAKNVSYFIQIDTQKKLDEIELSGGKSLFDSLKQQCYKEETMNVLGVKQGASDIAVEISGCYYHADSRYNPAKFQIVQYYYSDNTKKEVLTKTDNFSYFDWSTNYQAPYKLKPMNNLIGYYMRYTYPGDYEGVANGNVTYSILEQLPTPALTPTPTPTPTTPVHWADTSIKKIKSILEISNIDTSFLDLPDKVITRGQYVLILQKALNIQKTNLNIEIMDMKDGPEKNAAEILASNRILEGAKNEMVSPHLKRIWVSPDSEAPREQIAAFNARIILGDKYSGKPIYAETPFDDVTKDNPFSGYINIMYDNKIMVGSVEPQSQKKGLFEPKKIFSVAEACTVAERMSEKLKNN